MLPLMGEQTHDTATARSLRALMACTARAYRPPRRTARSRGRRTRTRPAAATCARQLRRAGRRGHADMGARSRAAGRHSRITPTGLRRRRSMNALVNWVVPMTHGVDAVTGQRRDAKHSADRSNDSSAYIRGGGGLDRSNDRTTGKQRRIRVGSANVHTQLHDQSPATRNTLSMLV